MKRIISLDAEKTDVLLICNLPQVYVSDRFFTLAVSNSMQQLKQVWGRIGSDAACH